MNNLYVYEPEQKPGRNVPLWVLVTIIALVVALLAASACYIFLSPDAPAEPEKEFKKSTVAFSENFYGVQLDISNMSQADIDAALLGSALKGYDNIIIRSNNIADTSSLLFAFQAAYNQGLSPYVLFDISAANNGFAGGNDLQQVGNHLRTLCSSAELSGIFFSDWGVFTPKDKPFSDLPFSYSIEDLCKIVRYTDTELFIGLYLEGNVEDNARPLAWISKGLFDTVLIDCGGYMNGVNSSFEANIKAWDEACGNNAETVFMLRSSRLGTNYMGWDEPNQLLWQAVTLNTESKLQFCMDSYNAVASDNSEATQKLYDFLQGLVDNNYIINDLIFTSPSAQNSTTYSSVVVFAGASDPTQPLLMDGQEIERDNLGHFEKIVDLEPGKNKIVFTHKSRDYTFNINYVQTIVALVYPDGTEYYDSGSTVSVSAVAKKGSTVTATIGDQTVTLKQEAFYEESVDTFGEYYTFVGSITLPVLSADTNMGKIIFEGTLGNETQTKEGGIIAVYKKRQPAPEVENNTPPPFTLPEEDGYIDVGTGYIAEVITDRAETFDGGKLNDYSQPTNSYLPAGTVDYCKSTADSLFDSENGRLNYRTLRYGKRVYEYSNRNGKEIKVYSGTLPDTNNVTLEYLKESDRNTTLAFNVDWKAPFRFELGGQKYIDDNKGEARPYYTVDSITYSYVDITFCYAAEAAGNVSISGNNPVFSSAEWIKNEADWTLRLYLRNTGSMYGWSAEYDDNDRLVFTFLHPATLTQADNIYGVSLEDTVILLDPGHTGTVEKGATHNLFGNNQKYNITEAMANLTLSLEIKRQLETLGATVYLTRTHNNLDSTLTLNQRLDMVKALKPDVFISVHHDYNKYASMEGFTSFYFTPMGWRLSQKIYDATEAASIYNDHHDNIWHTLFVTRITDCPAILTENGFMSNDSEYQNIITNASANQKRAAATVKGIVDYFKSIQ